ncbi:hypothetical protein RhiLY_03645 [Ceratobasidium sp. AG-Ba]|nr:hypothetical protein RhiLY_03645 [Ceratobasidium sp. AG-Ba]
MAATQAHLANGDDNGMLSHIHVLHPTHNAPLTLAVPPGAKVADLKTAIAEQCPGQPKPNGQRIIWNGRIVVDEEVVGDIWKPGHDTHTVHLAVHPSAWSSPQQPPNPYQPPLLPPHLRIAKDYIMFHHTNALRVMAGQPLEPWTNPWGMDHPTATYWAYSGLASCGHQLPQLLTMPYPAQSANEVGLEYNFVNIDNRPYLSWSNPGATPTAMQQHAVAVLSSTLPLIPHLDRLAVPALTPSAPVQLTYYHYPNPARPAQTSLRRARRIAVALRTVIPLSFTLLRASLFIARMILNRANEAVPNPQPDNNNNNPNRNAPNANANRRASPVLGSLLDHATLTRVETEAGSLDLEVPEREFRPAPRDTTEESRVREMMVRARTFLVLFGVTLFPAAWARRREALRLREGKVRVVYGERANLIGRRPPNGESQTLEAGSQPEQQQEQQVEEVPLGDRRRFALREGGWRREYVERVLNGFEEHVE